MIIIKVLTFLIIPYAYLYLESDNQEKTYSYLPILQQEYYALLIFKHSVKNH